MSIRVFSLSLLVALLTWHAAFASEHEASGHEAAAEEHGGGHEEKKEEGGEHGGGHGEAKTQVAPWVEVENKIQELYSKIKSKEATIIQLLEEKDHMPNGSPMLQHTVKEIVREHKELRGLAEDYEKNLNILKYRFPERNAKQERSYGKIEVKSIDDMEQALGIDGKLTRNMKKMRTQFGVEAKPEVVHHTVPKSAVKPPKDQSIEEASTIILQK